MKTAAHNPGQPNERPVITPNTDGVNVLGGVFRAHSGVVVDFEENPEPFEAIYDKVAGVVSSKDGARYIGDTVNYFVLEAVPFAADKSKTSGVLKALASARGQSKLQSKDEVYLSEFIKSEAAICYHQALVNAAIINLLQARRDIGGAVSIDKRPALRHTWTRYTKDGQKVAIDTAEEHVTSLTEGEVARRDQQYLREHERPAA